jgi:hypothetical protein
MGYSRQPSSPEFEAIKWREGRYGFATHRDVPMLVAEFDIDNNGQTDLVLKSSFMVGFEPSHGSAPGGEDTLLVFATGALDLERQIYFGPGFRVATNEARPAMIHGGYELRLIRPFILNAVVFLSAYEQVWEGGEFQDLGARFSRLEGEYTNVLRYKSGAHLLAPGRWSDLDVERVCRYRMEVVSKR